MGVTLTGKSISTTYLGILKLGDNAIVDGTTREVSDGAGNATAIKLSNAELEIPATKYLKITGGMRDSAGDVGDDGQALVSDGAGGMYWAGGVNSIPWQYVESDITSAEIKAIGSTPHEILATADVPTGYHARCVLAMFEYTYSGLPTGFDNNTLEIANIGQSPHIAFGKGFLNSVSDSIAWGSQDIGVNINMTPVNTGLELQGTDSLASGTGEGKVRCWYVLIPVSV